MKKISALFTGFLAAAITMHAQVPCSAVQNLSAAQVSALQPLSVLLDTALYHEDLQAIDSLNAEARSVYASQAGYPETAETFYTLTSSTTWLSLPSALQLSRLLIAQDSMVYVDCWKLCKGMKPPAYLPHSLQLRAGAQICAGLLKMAAYETDVSRRNLYEQWARRGLDSLLTMQLPSGAFPFPDLRTYNDPVFTPIINNFLQSLGNDSVNVLSNGWITDDRGTGEFKFDAGLICRAFAEAFHYTGDSAYLQSAQFAAGWLVAQHFNTNYNYNSFVSTGLAETFAIDGNMSWLNRGADNLRYAVLPGQTAFGAWTDGHNARSVYHNIILENSALLVSLLPASHPYRDTIADMLIRGSRYFLNRFYSCGSSVGYNGLMALYPLDTGLIPQSLHDSIGDLIGRYINQSNINGRYLDVHTMGNYLELLASLSSVPAHDAVFGLDAVIYPNPFVSTLNIRFELKQAATVRIRVMDSRGRMIETIADRKFTSGMIENSWTPSAAVKAGTYLLVIETGSRRYTRKILFTPN